MANIVPLETRSMEVGMPLIPASIDEAIALANLMAKAKLVPKDLQGSPSDCLMVVMQAKRWRMDPFAVAQECSVIQGKLMHSGKLTAAVINTLAPLQRRLEFKYGGEGDGRYIEIVGTVSGESVERKVRVELKNAKTANQQWTKQPDQQLAYHGARVWARRFFPELMLGVYAPEEFDRGQIIENDAPVVDEKPAATNEIYDVETGEVVSDKDRYLEAAKIAAAQGTSALVDFMKTLPKNMREFLHATGPHGPELREIANKADAAALERANRDTQANDFPGDRP